jgi:HYR domain
LSDDQNFAIITQIHQPYVFDNSDNFTVWTTPAVKEKTGAKLFAGNHTFTYVAVDAFKNKAKCNVTIFVIDVTPPVIENCMDPTTFYTVGGNANNETLIEWDEPKFYDNSEENITVYRNLSFGYLKPGEYKVRYNASDIAGNWNVCIINVTVKETHCDNLPSPAEGQTVCAKNTTHTWCEITCKSGFSLYDDADDVHFETLTLYCLNLKPSWKYDVIPDCTGMSSGVHIG